MDNLDKIISDLKKYKDTKFEINKNEYALTFLEYGFFLTHHNNTEKHPYCYLLKDKITHKYQLNEKYPIKIDLKVIKQILDIINSIDLPNHK